MALLRTSNIVGFTKPPRGSQLWFINDMSVRKYSEIVATTTMGNSTAETTIASMSVPALAFSNRGGIRATVSGVIRDDSLPSESVILRTDLIVSGSTSAIAQSTGISLSPSTAGRSWVSEVVILGTTSSTELRSWHIMQVSDPSTELSRPVGYNGTGDQILNVPNSTAAATLNFTLQFSTASTSVGASVRGGMLETLA